MAVNFNIPASPKINIYQNENFLGCDFTSDGSTVDDTHSPDCLNMTRLVPGKVRKRMGYKELTDYGAPIYGVHYFSTIDTWLVHAGNKIYNLSAPTGEIWVDDDGNEVVDYDENDILFLTGNVDTTLIYTGMAEQRSFSVELGLKLVIMDGTHLYTYDGTDFKVLQGNDAYIPMVTIARLPKNSANDNTGGGGSPFEALNLINPAFQEGFTVPSDKAEAKIFPLSFNQLDSSPNPRAWVLNSSGNWIEKTYGTDFTINRTTGVVTFTNAPGVSPVRGENSVKIQAYKTIRGYADRINHCRFGILFGVNGLNDRLFVSGNPGKGLGTDGKPYSYINYDWYSEMYDPSYFPDTGYSKLGADSSAIMGYSIIGGYLATHKDTNEVYQPVIIREGDMIDGNPSFLVVNALQGAGAISPWCFSYLEEEPLFFSKLGIYAITAQDITGEKYAQNRSYYLDGKLLEEEDLHKAFAYVWRDFYILCINGHCYILDGLQPIRTDKSKPYSTRQYVGFYWDNIPATCMFEMGGNLCFGSNDGKIYMFYSHKEDVESYNDVGEPITCRWETADISERLFYKYKKYRYLALKCLPSRASSIEIWAQRNGLWEMIKEDDQTLRFFDFNFIKFDKFSFSPDNTAKVLPAKVRLRKLDHVRFRFVNEQLNEPLGLINFAVEYTQGGNHK